MTDNVRVTDADPGAAVAVAQLWVALAAEQREHGSRLLAEANRTRIRERATHYAATDQLLVARTREPADEPVEESASDALIEGSVDDDSIEGSASYNSVEESVSDDSAGTPDIVGFVMFGTRTDRYETDRQRGLVENLYVVPEYRGEGVGSALLAAAERRLRERSVDAVSLEVLAANERARRFYRRHGYEQHRVTVEKPLDGDE